MLEDIDCFLGSGQLPSIFAADEEADIILHLRDAVRATGQPDTQVSESKSEPVSETVSSCNLTNERTSRVKRHSYFISIAIAVKTSLFIATRKRRRLDILRTF